MIEVVTKGKTPKAPNLPAHLAEDRPAGALWRRSASVMRFMSFFRQRLCLFAFAVLSLLLAAASASAQPAATGSNSAASFITSRLDRMREHIRLISEALPAMPENLDRVAQAFRAATGETSVGRIALGVLICLVVGAAFEWGARRATAGLHARRRGHEVSSVADRLLRIGIDGLRDVLALAAFALGALALLEFQTQEGPIHEVGAVFLTALLGVRLVFGALRLLLRPSEKSDRSLAAFDLAAPAARFWYGYLGSFVAWFAFGWAVITTLQVFGLPREGRQILAYVLGLGLVTIAIAIVWRQPKAEPAATGHPAGNAQRWLASIIVVAFWLVWAMGAMTTFWLMVVVVGLPIAIRASRRAARHVMRPVEGEDGASTVASVASVFVEQGLRVALIIGAIMLLLWGWDLDVGSLADRETTFARLLRGSLHALIILLGADLVWNLVKALSDNMLARAQAAEGTDAEETRRRARVRTLLPIGRNVAFAVLFVMAGLMALAALGVEIGPLIASAGVVGVAVGFGAQTVVRDIISGMFYMIDDAFRVGEYIQSGNYRGTVESFSLRSVKLRHQRGPLFTVPFGALGAVQNMSRDWVVVKDLICITHDSDIEKARKLVKQIGLDLAQDPVMGPNILQPLKMQGVQQFGEYGMDIRTKMMTKPGEQFVIRRKANALIKKAFDENGIQFALPRVHIASSGTGTSTDVAAAAAAASQALKHSHDEPH